MEGNVFLISLAGIIVVFSFLFILFVIMKLFKYIPSVSSKDTAIIERGKKELVKNNNFKKEVENEEIIAAITAVMAGKNINGDRITIKKRG